MTSSGADDIAICIGLLNDTNATDTENTMQVTPLKIQSGDSPDDLTWATKVETKNAKNINGLANDDTSSAQTDKDELANTKDELAHTCTSKPAREDGVIVAKLDFTFEGLKKNLHDKFKVVFQGACVEKLVFVTSVTCLMLVGYGIVGFPWILPYFYTGALPFLFGLRFWLYWGKKWQLFLLDYCYFANLLLLIYLWACPGVQQVFCAVFAMANGPVFQAIISYRNTLAFHSLDRMTSVFIHVLPAMVTFAIRWYPTSMRWYTGFANIEDDQRLPWEWILAVPYGVYILHAITYYSVVHLCIKPDEQYLDTYRHMTGQSGGIISKMCNACGPRYAHLVFIALNWIYTLFTFLCAALWFKYFIAHCTFIVITGLVLVWNGASFYLDVFSNKGLDAEPYRFCVK